MQAIGDAGKMDAPGGTVRKRFIDWVVTVPFLALFGLTLLAFDLPQRVARLFGPRPQEIVAGALQVALTWAIRVTGARISTERSPRGLPHHSYLILANHQSMFDIPILGAELFTNYLKYVSKRELGRWLPSISYNLRRGGNALIERGDRQQATRAIRELGAAVTQRGVSAVLYPEGTRARQGKLGRFKTAGALALLLRIAERLQGPIRAALIGPIVEPQARSLRVTKCCGSKPASRHSATNRPEVSASLA